MMNDNPVPQERLDFEEAIHHLLCTPAGKADSAEVLLSLCRDPAARETTEQIIATQTLARRSVGLGEIDAAMSSNAARLLTRLRREERRPPVRIVHDEHGASPPMNRLALWSGWAVAASLLLGAVIGYVLWPDGDSGAPAQPMLAAGPDAPAVKMDARIERSRAAWRMVATSDDTWLLLNEGEGVFGTIAPDGKADIDDRRMVFIHCRLINERGREVYDADLLVPEGAAQIQLADAGRIEGRTASLQVSTTGNEAIVGLMVDGASTAPLGVSGQTAIDGASRELGRFKLDDETLYFNVTTERIGDFTY